METIRPSLYWDDFERRIEETVAHVRYDTILPVRRVAVFVTDGCNFRCKYCNISQKGNMILKSRFQNIIDVYGTTAIIHITGGEPSMIPWLYPFLEEHCGTIRFHLNTNAYILPPLKAIKRLKISLDHHNAEYWDGLVGKQGAFKAVVKNIKISIPQTVTSITYTLTHDNYKDAVNFSRFAKKEFVGIYAIFFSVYKGMNPLFAFTQRDCEDFFHNILPQLKNELSGESLALLNETIDEKRRIIQGVRFPENAKISPCYISMSEKVISPLGIESYCSHLYRDNIFHTRNEKHKSCLYGCNRRLIKFNEQVDLKLKQVPC